MDIPNETHARPRRVDRFLGTCPHGEQARLPDSWPIRRDLRTRRAVALVLAGWISFVGGGGCAHAEPRPGEFPSTDEDVVWPPPPDPPRIRYEGALASPRDVGFRPSILRRVVSLISGTREARIQQPYGVAVDSLRIAVADPAASGVHVFDLGRGRHRLLRGTDRHRFVQPIGIALDGDDVWVSDPEAGAVFRMSEDGREAARIEKPLIRPAGIAVRPDLGLVYVVDVHAHQVRVFDRDGRARFSFGGRGSDVGSFNYPTNIAIDRDGRVYVTDSMNFRVQIFTAEGEYLRSFGRAGDREGDLPRPKGIGVDSRGHVYVVEGLYDAINVFDRDGRHLLTFGGPGTRAGEFWLATGLAVDDRNRVWIADSFNGRLQVFRYVEED